MVGSVSSVSVSGHTEPNCLRPSHPGTRPQTRSETPYTSTTHLFFGRRWELVTPEVSRCLLFYRQPSWVLTPQDFTPRKRCLCGSPKQFDFWVSDDWSVETPTTSIRDVESSVTFCRYSRFEKLSTLRRQILPPGGGEGVENVRVCKPYLSSVERLVNGSPTSYSTRGT